MRRNYNLSGDVMASIWHRMRAGLWAFMFLAGLAGITVPLIAPSTQAQDGRGTAVVVDVDGAIGPALAYRVGNIIAEAEGKHEFVILRMDTPGGLDASMRDIIQDILKSRVPVATYVSPGGARAASAGTYILYASHVAAMAPATTLGAATPVQLGGSEEGGEEEGRMARRAREGMDEIARAAGFEAEEEEEPGAAPKSAAAATGEKEGAGQQDTGDEDDNSSAAALRRKVVNDAAAYIRGLANRRGRNAEWAERAVREAATLTASEAAAINVIDFVASDISALLEQAHGREVEIDGVGKVTLQTRDLQVVVEEMTWIQTLLELITDPNIALILMQIGVLGLIMELYNPGAIYPGVVGLFCLLLGLIALSVLPVNAGGIILMVVGLAFMIAEIFIASGGLLAVVGALAFGLGAFFLFDSPIEEFRVSLSVVLISTGIMAALVFAAVGYGLAAQRRKVVSGAEALVGMTGTVTRWEGNEGYVLLDGETWRARSDAPLSPGQKVRAVRTEGIVIWVEPA